MARALNLAESRTDLGHAIVFYDSEAALAPLLVGRLREVWSSGGAVVLIACRRNRERIEELLQREASCLRDALATGRYVCLDADETIAEITVDGVPSELRFRQRVGTAIARAGLRGTHLAVFAEMVGMLCERGLLRAAEKLEDQWNRLAEQFNFSLTCACPSWAMDDVVNRRQMQSLFSRHIQTLADEPYEAPPPRQRELELIVSSTPQDAQLPSRQPHTELAFVAPARSRALIDRRVDSLVASAIQHGLEAGVVCVNLDRFGQIIEMLGYSAAHALLEAAAERIAECTNNQHLIERLGNDEFAVLLEGALLTDAATRLAQRILTAFREPLVAGRHRVIVSASVGIEVAAVGEMDADSLSRHASLAMRSAKQRGGNSYQRFDSSMEKALRQRFDIEQKLRLALAHDEFLLHYQPIFNVGTGEIESLEALIRWQPPEGGMVSPANFIPIAEETGLIVEIGDWALREACLEARRLQLLGFPDLQMAVNFSARQLREPRIAARVQRILQETGLDPSFLVLELTESMLLEDNDVVQAALWSLKALGLRLALDDFGTGYSSLSYLKHMPIDCLKVDQSFVRDIGKDAESEAIVRSVLAIGRCMKLHVVAEGVETEQQFAFLSANNCHAAQGYLLGRPSVSERILPLLHTAASLARHVSLARARI